MEKGPVGNPCVCTGLSAKPVQEVRFGAMCQAGAERTAGLFAVGTPFKGSQKQKILLFPDAECGTMEEKAGHGPRRLPAAGPTAWEVFCMRKNFGAKPWTYPQPVFILGTYGPDGTPDAMNAAWGGISDDTQISLCISAGHKTTANLLARKAFTVSMATADQLVACDYVGIASGNTVTDKLAKAGWHTTPSAFVDAPCIDELPMTVECRLVSYDPESCRLVGEIVNVSADESVLDADGKIDPDKLRPLVFDPIHNTYRVLGEVAGRAFHDGAALR